MNAICLAQKILPSAFVAGTDGRDLLLTCVLPPEHSGDHRCGHYRWPALAHPSTDPDG